jgi:hypothetical protein
MGVEVHTGVWWKNMRGKNQFGRLRHRWENNIKMGPQQIG